MNTILNYRLKWVFLKEPRVTRFSIGFCQKQKQLQVHVSVQPFTLLSVESQDMILAQWMATLFQDFQDQIFFMKYEISKTDIGRYSHVKTEVNWNLQVLERIQKQSQLGNSVRLLLYSEKVWFSSWKGAFFPWKDVFFLIKGVVFSEFMIFFEGFFHTFLSRKV